MFNEPLIDPTAGERARQIRSHPDWPQPVTDPTDPRSGAYARVTGSEEPKRGPYAPERADPAVDKRSERR